MNFSAQVRSPSSHHPDICPEVEADEKGEIHTDEKNVWADEVAPVRG